MSHSSSIEFNLIRSQCKKDENQSQQIYNNMQVSNNGLVHETNHSELSLELLGIVSRTTRN